MLKNFRDIFYTRDPRIDEILRLQALINNSGCEHRLGVMFTTRWGQTYVLISFSSEIGVERSIKYDLNSAYCYVSGIADGIFSVQAKNLH